MLSMSYVIVRTSDDAFFNGWEGTAPRWSHYADQRFYALIYTTESAVEQDLRLLQDQGFTVYVDEV